MKAYQNKRFANQEIEIPASAFSQSSDPNIQPSPINISLGGIPQHWLSTQPLSRRDMKNNTTPLSESPEGYKIIRFEEFSGNHDSKVEDVNEVGDLKNIKSYSYTKLNSLNYVFYANINGEKASVIVHFQNIEDEIEDFILTSKIDNNLKKYSQDGIYNMGFSINKETSQYAKTSLTEYFPILKTISNIVFAFIDSRGPVGITFFGENKKGNGGIDPQKTLLYFKLLSSNLPDGYLLDNIEYQNKGGYIIYKDFLNI
jgi:hypothetical protein